VAVQASNQLFLFGEVKGVERRKVVIDGNHMLKNC
jgi:FKBP-type peptidyl-prolyl cis-trans isomerase 2